MKTNKEILSEISVPRSEASIVAERERKARAPYAKTVAKIVLAVMYYMEQKGLSQKQLAEGMGVSSAYISKLMRGKENLTIETISKLEDVLGEKILNVAEPYKKVNAATPTIVNKLYYTSNVS